MPLIQERLEKIQTLSLKAGAHSPNSTFCILEVVAFVAGEPWSDHPECACPIIGAFLRSWNDFLPTDADRDRLLKPLIRDLVGSKSTKELEQKRALLCADWLIRVNTPTWLRLTGLTVHADALEALPEITAFAQVPSMRGTIEAAHTGAYKAWATDAAGDAAWDAAGDAARAAAGAAARAAAGAAAGDAAQLLPPRRMRGLLRGCCVGCCGGCCGGCCAGCCGRCAGLRGLLRGMLRGLRTAAGAAARAAAGVKLQPTVLQLQDSALSLVRRMLEAE